jgi:predicted DNA-binding ribbon-helix-helix protein
MENARRRAGRPRIADPRPVRASFTLSPDTYRTLEALAKQRKVSTAWIMRDAAERYIAEQRPLSPDAPRS